MSFEKQHIVIRSAKREDVKAILAIYAPFITDTPISFETSVPGEDDFWKRIETYQKTAPWLVCEIDQQIVGYAYAGDHRARAAYQWSKDLSVYVHQDFHKRKVATGLYTTLIELLKKQGVISTFIGVTLPNPASVGFHEKMGYRPIGIYHNVGYKFGKWWSVGWWEMPIGNYDTTPGTILLPEEIETKGWETAVHIGVSKII